MTICREESQKGFLKRELLSAMLSWCAESAKTGDPLLSLSSIWEERIDYRYETTSDSDSEGETGNVIRMGCY